MSLLQPLVSRRPLIAGPMEGTSPTKIAFLGDAGLVLVYRHSVLTSCFSRDFIQTVLVGKPVTC